MCVLVSARARRWTSGGEARARETPARDVSRIRRGRRREANRDEAKRETTMRGSRTRARFKRTSPSRFARKSRDAVMEMTSAYYRDATRRRRRAVRRGSASTLRIGLSASVENNSSKTSRRKSSARRAPRPRPREIGPRAGYFACQPHGGDVSTSSRAMTSSASG